VGEAVFILFNILFGKSQPFIAMDLMLKNQGLVV